MSGGITLLVDGEPVTGAPGQSVAAVLVAAGRPGGVFCGMGVCFGCLVTVNGERDVRACLRDAGDGDVVGTQPREPS
ncbi:(2Fe-2S)-binding protein [Streptomyces boncukensis]|uniref:(2Fe-2S)-binding protein n=1 Tax=Streptomyces boncukensis TaxID=2711219 RepID=A0A6G4X3G0_9ACTN|nr:(2Fe-2S)-binding protein [Streptomyces boncukensis]NGO71387.1 (2Fe-2S)-binding protein [Streptomyces boncukensis]